MIRNISRGRVRRIDIRERRHSVAIIGFSVFALLRSKVADFRPLGGDFSDFGLDFRRSAGLILMTRRVLRPCPQS